MFQGAVTAFKDLRLNTINTKVTAEGSMCSYNYNTPHKSTSNLTKLSFAVPTMITLMKRCLTRFM